MSTAALMPEMLPERKRIRRGWCYFLIENLDEFARLAWYLVADVALVECVMVRLVARLEGTPFGGAPTSARAAIRRDRWTTGGPGRAMRVAGSSPAGISFEAGTSDAEEPCFQATQ
jgi:hypothetical protein